MLLLSAIISVIGPPLFMKYFKRVPQVLKINMSNIIFNNMFGTHKIYFGIRQSNANTTRYTITARAKRPSRVPLILNCLQLIRIFSERTLNLNRFSANIRKISY